MKNPKLLFWIVFLAGIVFRIGYISADFIDLAADEAYYWQWSRNLDWCYYSKGPLIAFLIWIGTHLLGDTHLGVRFMTLVLSVVTLLVSYHLYKKLFPKDDTGPLLMVVFYHTIPLMMVGSILLTIDPPLCAAWTVALWALYTAAHERKTYAWLLLSLALGFGILAKYTMLLFIPTLLGYLALSQRNREWLRHPAPYLSLFGGLLFFLAPLWWNATHQWVSFWHTAELGGLGKTSYWYIGFKYFPEMILTQMGIISPILFVLLAIGVWRHVKRAFAEDQSEASVLLASSVLPILLLYSVVSLKRSINPNWLAAIYPAAILAGAQVWSENFQQNRWRRWLYSGILLGMVLCLLMLFSDVFHILNLPQSERWDPAARLKGWQEFAETAYESSEKLPPDNRFFYFGIQYQTASAMAFYIPGNPKTYCASSRPLSNQYDIWGGSDALVGQNAVLAMRTKTEGDPSLPDYITQSFERIVPDTNVPYSRFGKTLWWDQTWLCYGFKGWVLKTELEHVLDGKS